eukprot:SRR837773.21041.p1 GENE.SRR837773.21041~~SRR837773.21041.p1  ORF type:complete len:337 (+),score=69.22 SRR837773.21041:114-1013(+)
MELAVLHAEPYLLGPLYTVLTTISAGLGSDAPSAGSEEARTWAAKLCAMGAHAETLEASYNALSRITDAGKRFEAALFDAVEKNLNGIVGRHADDDLRPYVAKEFWQYYMNQADIDWTEKWLASPQQKRIGPDGQSWFAWEFKRWYGEVEWEQVWATSPLAVQYRVPPNAKKPMDMQAFSDQYGLEDWQDAWMQAAEIRDVCAGLNHEDCDAMRYLCMWDYDPVSKDWSSACVPPARIPGTARLDVCEHMTGEQCCTGRNRMACEMRPADCTWTFKEDWAPGETWQTACKPKRKAVVAV